MSAEFRVLAVTSTAFHPNEFIPKKYTCEGEDINPPLDVGGFPQETKSLAIIIDDPDAPRGMWVHWVLWNIPITHHIDEKSIPGLQGWNDFGRNNYGGPCPPSGTHRYFFKVYALDATLELPANTTKQQLEQAMIGHILAFGELIGLYKRAGR